MSIAFTLFCIVLSFYFADFYLAVEVIVVESVLGEVVDMMCLWGEHHDDNLGLEWYRLLASQDFEVNMMRTYIVRDKYQEPDIPYGLQKKVRARIKTTKIYIYYLINDRME